MNLYVVTIVGNRFYFWGNLSEEECEKVEKLCDRITSERIGKSVEEIVGIFQTSLENLLGKEMEFVKVKHVFRI